jgi:hypothetical protein
VFIVASSTSLMISWIRRGRPLAERPLAQHT